MRAHAAPRPAEGKVCGRAAGGRATRRAARVHAARVRPPLSRRAKLVIGVALGSAVLALAIGPFLLMTIPDPKPYRLAGLDGERSGTFVAVNAATTNSIRTRRPCSTSPRTPS